MKDSITFRANVLNVEEKFYKEWTRGVGANAAFDNISLGWFVLLEGSHEAFFAGFSRPNIAVGDKATVRITFDGRQ